jgi:hypothetical protein
MRSSSSSGLMRTVMSKSTRCNRWMAMLVGGVIAVAVTVVGTGAPADAATRVTFTGGQIAAPYGTAATPSVASNGSLTLLVWSEKVGGTFGIYGRITSADTTSIAGRITIASTAGHDSVLPDVAWDRSNNTWLVVWQYTYSSSDHDILGRTVTTAGSVGPELRINTLSSDQRAPTVAAAYWDVSIVAYVQGAVTDATRTDIYVTSFTDLGLSNSIRASFDTADDPSADFNPDIGVSWDGIEDANFRVVWDAQSAESSAIEARWYGDGSGETQTLVSVPWYTPVSAPAVARSGVADDAWLVTYEYNHGTGTIVDIWGVVVGYHRFKTFPISTKPRSEREPAVAYNGTFLVAWTDRRDDPEGDVYGARVSVDGTVLDPNGFLITAYTPEDDRAALTSVTSAKNTFGVAWELTPSGQGTGIATYGITVAPK